MQWQENPATRTDLEHDLARLKDQGEEGVDVVAFEDIRDIGAPLALSLEARRRVYAIAMDDLYRQLLPWRPRATA